MRKVQDHYFKKAKKEHYPARSVYKLEEAQRKFHLLRPGDSVLDLGCHPGSWSMYAARVVGPAGMVVGVDMEAGHPVAGAADNRQAPIHRLVADVTDPGLPAKLTAITPRFQAVLSDIAPRTTGNRLVDQQRSLRLAERCLEIAGKLLAPGGCFYCKIFQGEDVREFVEELRHRFRLVRTVKPKSSRAESKEIFVLATGFTGPGSPEDLNS